MKPLLRSNEDCSYRGFVLLRVRKVDNVANPVCTNVISTWFLVQGLNCKQAWFKTSVNGQQEGAWKERTYREKKT